MTTVTTGTREITYLKAINEAIIGEMERDADVFVAGIDLAARGDVFGTTAGILPRFGPERIIDTPISENAIAGLAIGAAALVGGRRWVATGDVTWEVVLRVTVWGVVWGVVVSSLAFGLWHILPSIGTHEQNPALASVAGEGRRGNIIAVALSVLTTTVAGCHAAVPGPADPPTLTACSRRPTCRPSTPRCPPACPASVSPVSPRSVPGRSTQRPPASMPSTRSWRASSWSWPRRRWRSAGASPAAASARRARAAGCPA